MDEPFPSYFMCPFELAWWRWLGLAPSSGTRPRGQTMRWDSWDIRERAGTGVVVEHANYPHAPIFLFENRHVHLVLCHCRTFIGDRHHSERIR